MLMSAPLDLPDDSASRRIGTRRIMLVVWVSGYLIGFVSHVADLVLGGHLVYDGFPASLRVFWISLTIIDPLIVILLLVRMRVGIVLAVAVILVDIAVNWTVFLTIGGNPLFGVVNQTVFAVFIVATTRQLWTFSAGQSADRRRV